MDKKTMSSSLRRRLLKAEQDEINGYAAYAYIAQSLAEKEPNNAAILKEISEAEKNHYEKWKTITGVSKRPHILGIKTALKFRGVAFVIDHMVRGEMLTQKQYSKLKEEIPDAAAMLVEEEAHEDRLLDMLKAPKDK